MGLYFVVNAVNELYDMAGNVHVFGDCGETVRESPAVFDSETSADVFAAGIGDCARAVSLFDLSAIYGE